MTRTIVFIFVLTACGSCLEMRETVERVVMVRKTGSDLQPEATGYLYKKESDGPASVTQMGESEVMAQLTKFYEQPQAYAAPIPAAAGPFYTKVEDENKQASQPKEHVIPVVEKSHEENDKEDGKEDGIADEDYGKLYENYKSDFDKYLKGLGYFEDGIYHEHGGGKEHDAGDHHSNGDKEYKVYKALHHYGKNNDGDYITKKYEGYSVSNGDGYKKYYNDDDKHGKHYTQGHGYKQGDHGHKNEHSNEEGTDGFHKLYDKDEDKKDHGFFDGSKYEGGYHKYDDGHKHYGSNDGGHKNGGSHESGHHESDYGKHGHHEKGSSKDHGAAHSAEKAGESSYGKHAGYGSKSGHSDGETYGFKVKH